MSDTGLKMHIAIIGTGISGLGAAYLLHRAHDIAVYEKNDYVGGHTRTVKADDTPVDTGFIVFNRRCYPNLCGLFERLDVPVRESSMSFGVSIDRGRLEYRTEGSLAALFAQPSNMLRPDFWRMLRDILKFNRNASAYLDDDRDLTLGECLDEMRLGDWFRKYYLLAMGGAIWSCPLDTMLRYPARTFIRFFDNHGLLTVNEQPQWYTVAGGSREYVKRLTAPFKDRIKTKCGVASVRRDGGKVYVTDTNGDERAYDAVVMASHADQSLEMLADASGVEREILGAFRYQPNKVILHGDTGFMPKRQKAWSSWVYLSETGESGESDISLSYWMNNLQGLPADSPLIVTLNPGRRPKETLVYDEFEFEHPVFDQGAIDAQGRIDEIQGRDGVYFCGAWQRYGFHEDGLLSAVNVARRIGVEIPWA